MLDSFAASGGAVEPGSGDLPFALVAFVDLMADPASYTSATVRISEMQERYAQIDEELLHALERWEVLDGK